MIILSFLSFNCYALDTKIEYMETREQIDFENLYIISEGLNDFFVSVNKTGGLLDAINGYIEKDKLEEFLNDFPDAKDTIIELLYDNMQVKVMSYTDVPVKDDNGNWERIE